jgi:guanine nucleotide-binding protein G(i) subunit alpha
MGESLDLFDDTINSKFFINTPIVLFLNKTDLFREKISRSSLTRMFPDYAGGLDFDYAYNYIRERYEEKNKNKHRKIFSYATCAMQANQLQQVFDSVKDSFVKKKQETA